MGSTILDYRYYCGRLRLLTKWLRGTCCQNLFHSLVPVSGHSSASLNIELCIFYLNQTIILYNQTKALNIFTEHVKYISPTILYVPNKKQISCMARVYMHIYWFNFDTLAQGNAYKPTKEPMNYRGPSGDRTHYLQTEATPPAASCTARSLHATEIVSKTQSQWQARGCTGQLTIRLECTGVSFFHVIYTFILHYVY